MNFKTSKSKTVIALALVFFILAPILLVNLATVKAAPTGTITSVAWDETNDPNGNNIVQNLGGVNVGDIIDVQISISGASGVNGWCIPTITWNPSVLQVQVDGSQNPPLTGVTEDNYLNGQYVTYNSKGVPTVHTPYHTSMITGYINNATGSIQGGIADGYVYPQSNTFTDPASSGELCDITFVVVGAGSTTVAISGCYLQASASDTTGTPISATSATITTAGFVAPEYAYGALAAVMASIAAFGAFVFFKKGIGIPTLSKYVR